MGLEAVQLVRERVERLQISTGSHLGILRPATRRHLKGFEEDAEHLASLGYRHELKMAPGRRSHTVVGPDRYIGGG